MLIKDQHCLELIHDAIERILEYSSGFDSADAFNDDYRSFGATMMNFIVIGEMVDKLSEDFKIIHNRIEWSKIKDFRNIVAHDYFGLLGPPRYIFSSLPFLNRKPEIRNQQSHRFGFG